MSLWFHPNISFAGFSRRAQIAKNDDELVVQGHLVINESRSPKNIRRRTWHAFALAVSKAFSKEQIEYVRDRYGFDLKAMAKKPDKPLLARHVHYFGVGGGVNTYHLKEAISKHFWFSRGKKLRKFSPRELRRLYAEATNYTYIPQIRNPQMVYGGPHKRHEHFVQDNYLIDMRRNNLFRGVGDMDERAYYSRLVMAIISLLETHKDHQDVKMIIPAPSIQKGQIDFYKIYKIIAGGGAAAIALVPISKDSLLVPLLCFRCTQQSPSRTDFTQSILGTMETYIGESGYEAIRKRLAKLMRDKKFTRGKKIRVLAYSQGGSHAAYFMRDHAIEKNQSRVEAFFGFNITGSAAVEVVNRWRNKINSLPDYAIPPRIYLDRNVLTKDGRRGDWVNGCGEKHFGWGMKHKNSFIELTEHIINDRPDPGIDPLDFSQWFPWLNLHACRPRDRDENKRYESNVYRGAFSCDPILDTYNRDHSLEDKRRHFGNRILQHLIFWPYAILDFIMRLFLSVSFFKDNEK